MSEVNDEEDQSSLFVISQLCCNDIHRALISGLVKRLSRSNFDLMHLLFSIYHKTSITWKLYLLSYHTEGSTRSLVLCHGTRSQLVHYDVTTGEHFGQ